MCGALATVKETSEVTSKLTFLAGVKGRKDDASEITPISPMRAQPRGRDLRVRKDCARDLRAHHVMTTPFLHESLHDQKKFAQSCANLGSSCCRCATSALPKDAPRKQLFLQLPLDFSGSRGRGVARWEDTEGGGAEGTRTRAAAISPISHTVNDSAMSLERERERNLTFVSVKFPPLA